MKDSSKKKLRGFSLIELMVAMSIFTILVMTATSAYMNALKRQRTVRYMGLISSEVNNIYNMISKDVRSASSIYNPEGDELQGIEGELGLGGQILTENVLITKRDTDSMGNDKQEIYVFDKINNCIWYKNTEDDCNGTCVPKFERVTLDRFYIENLLFNVYESREGQSNSKNAPYVIMAYTAYYQVPDDFRGKEESTRVDISSTLSMRSVIRTK